MGYVSNAWTCALSYRSYTGLVRGANGASRPSNRNACSVLATGVKPGNLVSSKLSGNLLDL